MASTNGDGGIQSKSFRILSIDGGGIRGLIPALMLAAIEKRTGRSISELFDLVAGTSAGGILALALTSPAESATPKAKYTASDLVGLYRERGKLLFRRSDPLAALDLVEAPGRRRLHLPKGNSHDLFRPKYTEAARETVLRSYLHSRLTDSVTGVFVPSYDTMLRKPVFFVSNSDHAVEADYFHNVSDVTTLDAALATSATPAYFPPHKVTQPNYVSPPGHYSLVDGGLFANNPTFLAMMHAVKYFDQEPTLDHMFVLSLGAGSLTRSYPYEQIKNWGQLGWAVPSMEMAFDGQSEAVGVMVEQLLLPKHYYRFQVDLTGIDDDIDDASDDNVKAMESAVDSLLDQKEREIEAVCSRLETFTNPKRTTFEERARAV